MRCVGLLGDCGDFGVTDIRCHQGSYCLGDPKILISESQVLDSVVTSLKKDQKTPAPIPELRRRGRESRILPLKSSCRDSLETPRSASVPQTSGTAPGLVTVVNPSSS